MKYYYSQGSKKVGPITAEELVRLKLNSSTLVWREGMEDWKEISQIDEFAEMNTTEPPPLPVNSEQSKIRFTWLVNIALITASILVWFEVNTILLTMPLAALIGLLGIYRCKNLSRFYKVVFYGPMLIIVGGLAIIILGELNENYDKEEFAAIINFPTGCILLLCIDKLWASVTG